MKRKEFLHLTGICSLGLFTIPHLALGAQDRFMQDLEALAMKITPKLPPKHSIALVKICGGYIPLKTLHRL